MPLAPYPCPWGAEKRLLWVGWSLVGRHLLPSLQFLYLDTMHALEDLLRSILRRNMTPQGLQLMVEVCNGVHCPGGGHLAANPPLFFRTLLAKGQHRGHLVLSAVGVCG